MLLQARYKHTLLICQDRLGSTIYRLSAQLLPGLKQTKKYPFYKTNISKIFHCNGRDNMVISCQSEGWGGGSNDYYRLLVGSISHQGHWGLFRRSRSALLKCSVKRKCVVQECWISRTFQEQSSAVSCLCYTSDSSQYTAFFQKIIVHHASWFVASVVNEEC